MLTRWLAVAVLAALGAPAEADWYWVEDEQPVKSTMNRHPCWYDQVEPGEFSGGDFISNFSDRKAGEASYAVNVRKAGTYQLWVRANPLLAKLAFRVNDGEWLPIQLERNQFDNSTSRRTASLTCGSSPGSTRAR